VLSGVVTLVGGAKENAAGPGDFLLVPKGGAHSFRNDHGPASMLTCSPPVHRARAISSYSVRWPPADLPPRPRSGSRSAKRTTSPTLTGDCGFNGVSGLTRCAMLGETRHCAQEMNHLAGILPAVYAAFGGERQAGP
jgi:hypothetical protein